jgi:hypothetical protein
MWLIARRKLCLRLFACFSACLISMAETICMLDCWNDWDYLIGKTRHGRTRQGTEGQGKTRQDKEGQARLTLWPVLIYFQLDMLLVDAGNISSSWKDWIDALCYWLYLSPPRVATLTVHCALFGFFQVHQVWNFFWFLSSPPSVELPEWVLCPTISVIDVIWWLADLFILWALLCSIQRWLLGNSSTSRLYLLPHLMYASDVWSAFPNCVQWYTDRFWFNSTLLMIHLFMNLHAEQCQFADC